MKCLVTGAAGFQIYYTGYSGDLAMIAVEKMHEGKIVRHTFHVRPRDLRRAEPRTGNIGGVRDVFIEPIHGTWQRVAVDFSTGYHLVGIVTKRDTDFEEDRTRKLSGGGRRPPKRPRLLALAQARRRRRWRRSRGSS